jgi:hypothetical protein
MDQNKVNEIVDHILYGDIHEEVIPTDMVSIPIDKLDVEQSTRVYCAVYVKRILTELFSAGHSKQIPIGYEKEIINTVTGKLITKTIKWKDFVEANKKPSKIKIISSRGINIIEEKYYTFLKENPMINITDKQFSTSYEGMEDFCRYSLAIFYDDF